MADETVTLWILRQRASGVYELWQQGDLVSEVDWVTKFDDTLDAIQRQTNLIITSGSGTATTLTGTATAGTSGPFNVASTAGFQVGDAVFFGDSGGTTEARIIATVPSSTTFTTTANLTNTYASGKTVSRSPVEIVDARSGAATLRARLDILARGVIYAKDYGVVGDGTTDDTTAIINALNAANGKLVIFPPGHFRITAPLSGTTAPEIRIQGAAPAYLTHSAASGLIPVPTGSDYATFTVSELPWATVFKCDNTNLIGAPDTATMNASNKLRLLKDVVAYGANGAKHGVYTHGNDWEIAGCTFALFQHFGIFIRGSVTSKMRQVATIDCGWNLAASGSATYPNTYYSGCGLFIAANLTAADYTTIGADRPTTINIEQFFAWQRNHMVTTMSGLRSMQASGLVSGSFRDIGGYSGFFFNISAVDVDGLHAENYSTSGLVAADAVPYALYVINSQLHLGQNYAANIGSALAPVNVRDTGNTGIGWQTTRVINGEMAVRGASRSSIRKAITVVTPGGTDNYDFKNVAEAAAGFNGFVAVSLVRDAAFQSYRRSFFAAATHKAGGAGWQPMTSSQIATDSALAGGFVTTLALSWVNGDLRVAVTWGASWTAGDAWTIDIGLFGLYPLSA